MNRHFQNNPKTKAVANRTAITALIRLTLLESWRGRSGRFLLFALIAIQLIASFAVQMAVTESQELRITTSAFLYRLCLIFALSVGMIASVVREHESGFIYVLLAHPISRLHYVVGRMLGFAIVALAASLSVMVVLAIWVSAANWGALLVWTLSLWLELLVTGAIALFVALGLRNMVGSMVVWLSFYILARVLDVAKTMAASPIGQDVNSFSVMLGQWLFNALGWIIPPLGNFTKAEWLLGYSAVGLEAAWILAVWAIAYAVVCTVAAAIDFYRHEV